MMGWYVSARLDGSRSYVLPGGFVYFYERCIGQGRTGRIRGYLRTYWARILDDAPSGVPVQRSLFSQFKGCAISMERLSLLYASARKSIRWRDRKIVNHEVCGRGWDKTGMWVTGGQRK